MRSFKATLTTLAIVFGSTIASPTPLSTISSSSSSPPTVTVQNGSYSGLYSSFYNQDWFLGMRYAKPQVRFTLAESLDSTWNGTQEADAYTPECMGYGPDDTGYTLSEDCLFLSVVRPAGINDTSNLPVLLWIHGGGLTMGGSADRRYNLTFIVQNSVEQGTPVVGVSIQYRLSLFGFAGSDEAQNAGIANLGFRDQRLALHWVNENIAAFGGDPSKVTIWGESSGAVSVFAQTIAYNGRDDGLFRGVLAESGFGGLNNHLAGGLNATDTMQDTYNAVVNGTSCASKVNTPDSLDCLRTLPFPELNKALNISSLKFFPVLDGDFIADYPPSQLQSGRFLKVPVLIGCNSDEGTNFLSGVGPEGNGTVNTDDEMRASIAAIIGANSSEETGKSVDQLVDELMYLYPNIQSLGQPALTRFPVITAGTELAQELGLQYRRAVALFGDRQMHYIRRRAAQAWYQYGIPVWSFRFDVPVHNEPVTMGVTHFTEFAFVADNINGDGYAVNPFGDEPSTYLQLAKTMSDTWVNFVNFQDPNGAPGSVPTLLPGGASWPRYDTTVGGGVGQNIVWEANGSYVEIDDYRAPGINWMIENSLAVIGN